MIVDPRIRGWNRRRRFWFPSRDTVFAGCPADRLRGASCLVARSPFQPTHLGMLQWKLPLRRCLSRGEYGHLHDDAVGECFNDEAPPPDMRTGQDADPLPRLDLA